MKRRIPHAVAALLFVAEASRLLSSGLHQRADQIEREREQERVRSYGRQFSSVLREIREDPK